MSSIDYATLMCDTPWCIRLEIIKLKMLLWIVQHMDDPQIRKIVEFEGERVTDCFEDDDGYCSLCARVWDEVANYDSGCSSTNHMCYKFVSDMIVTREAQLLSRQMSELADKIGQIDELQRERDRMQIRFDKLHFTKQGEQ